MWWKNNTHLILHTASASTMAVALALVFLVAPREAVMGDVQRIFYFHVSAAWTGYLALLVALCGSLLYLIGARNRVFSGDPIGRTKPGFFDTLRWDALALSSVEVGLVLITQGILTGSMWAKATWGVWWTWEPRLTTSAVLWLIYAAYLALRRAIEEQSQRARLAAVYAILGFVAVPINFMAIRWWRTVHPLVFNRAGGNLSPAMLAVLIFCIFAFTLLYTSMLLLRFHLQRMQDQVGKLRQGT
jgi:heme exporter protein C